MPHCKYENKKGVKKLHKPFGKVRAKNVGVIKYQVKKLERR